MKYLVYQKPDTNSQEVFSAKSDAEAYYKAGKMFGLDVRSEDPKGYFTKLTPPIRTQPLVIEMSGGCLVDVHNLPNGYEYILVDHDNLSDKEAKKLLSKHVRV